MKDNRPSVKVNLIVEPPATDRTSLKNQWQQWVRDDKELGQLYQMAVNGPKVGKVNKYTYALHKKLSPVVDEEGFLVVGRASDDEGALIVPKQAVPWVVNSIHGTSHASSQVMIQQLKQRYWWATRTKDVTRKCMSCIKCQYRRKHRNVAGIGSIGAGASKLKHWCMDLQIPGRFGSKKDPNAVKIPAALIVADVMSGFVIGRLLPNKLSATVRDELWTIMCFFGTPSKITCDLGTEFMGHTRTLCKGLHVELDTTTTGNHQANGLAERAIQSVKEKWGALVDDMPVTDAFYMAVSQVNQVVSEPRGYTPYELMFTTSPTDDVGRSIERESQKTLSGSKEDQLDRMLMLNATLAEKVSNNRAKAHDRAAYYHDKNKPPQPVIVPDMLVVVRQEGKAVHGNSTMANAHRNAGPFKTVKKTGNGHSWLLKDIETNDQIARAERLLVPYQEDEMLKQSVVKPWPTEKGLISTEAMKQTGRAIQKIRTQNRRMIRQVLAEEERRRKQQEREDADLARQIEREEVQHSNRQRQSISSSSRGKEKAVDDEEYLPPTYQTYAQVVKDSLGRRGSSRLRRMRTEGA